MRLITTEAQRHREIEDGMNPRTFWFSDFA
jgi:hypothetical protein